MKKEIWKNYFDVVILPPKEISDYAIKLSKDLKKYKTKWALGKNSFIPHISLYHIAVKPKNFTAFVSELEKIAKDFSPGFLSTTFIRPNSLSFNKPEWIRKFYLKVIKNTVQFHDWSWGTDKTWLRPIFNLEKKFMKKYGTPQMGKNFKPHVSLTSFKNEKPNIKTKKAKKFQFQPDFLYVCELGVTHSCQRIVKKIPFKK